MAGLQTAAWIFVFWHLGLPVTVMAYALLREAPPGRQLVSMSTSAAIASTVAAAAILAALVAALAIVLRDLLPMVVLDELRLTGNVGVSATVVLLSVAAFVVLARRQRSVLDLWLLVVVFAWVLDALLTWMTESRFTGAWYANRVVRIISANVVLFVLLIESTRIYSRLAASILAQRREREARVLSMEAMAAAIEHELRQPLGAITANAQAARLWLEQARPGVEQVREAVDGIVDDTQRAIATLRSMRQLFADRLREIETLDANKVVEEAVDLARVELESLAIGIQLQLSARLPTLVANRRQLEEVILNLVNNAAESMREVTGHAVVLSITTAPVADNRVEIAVADTGSGIPDQDLERIFDPFFTTKPGGTGMGLAICKSIVEQHGGTMSVSHAEPYGSVFRVVLPGK
jgi:signal transduction histidine kinase